MKSHRCAECPMRTNYEQKPKSLAGRFWRWHINFCPGWKGYFNSLPSDEKEVLREKYQFTKH